MQPILPPVLVPPVLALGSALALGASIGIGRHVSLRQLDHPVVVAHWYWLLFWIVGLALDRWPPRVQIPSVTTVVLILASYGAFVSGAFAVLRFARTGNRHDSSVGAKRRAGGGPTTFALIAVLLLGTLAWGFFTVRVGFPLLGPNPEQARVTTRYGLGWLVLPAIWLLILGCATLVDRLYQGGARSRYAVWLVVAVAAVMITSFGSRGPVLVLLVAAAWLAFRSTGRLPSWSLLAGGIIAALLSLAAAAAARAGEPVTQGLIVARTHWLTIVNILNLDRVVQFIPASHPPLLGQSYVMDLSVLLPGHQPNFSEWLKEGMGVSFPGGGVTIGLVGELYANWGVAFAIAGCAAYGAFLAWLGTTTWWGQRLSGPVRILLCLSLAAPIRGGLAPALVNNVMPLLTALAVLRLADAVALSASMAAARRRVRATLPHWQQQDPG